MNDQPARVLIVDDQAPNRDLLEALVLRLGLRPLLAENGIAALDLIEKTPPDLILLDIMMPIMDGYEVLTRLKASPETHLLPVIMITGVDGRESATRCIRLGADDYLVKPFNATLFEARLQACLLKKRLMDEKEALRLQLEINNATLENRVADQVREISNAQLSSIFAMSKLAESRDPETGEHLERMREYTRVLTQRMRELPQYANLINDKFIEDLYHASPLHDVGKVGVPDRILLKPGRLDHDEFEIMKKHAEIGANTLRIVAEKHPGNEFAQMGIDIAHGHHEKWDGSGYPRALSGAGIPLSGRILALGDVYDALTSKRCYKEAFTHEKSRKIIEEGRGQHFDPDVVDAFLNQEEAFIKIREEFQHMEDSAPLT